MVTAATAARAQRAWDHWRALGSPKWVCAPMVDGSELAFRQLCRKYGVQLAYTPMLNSKLFANDGQYRAGNFTTVPLDRPLVAQFCADNPDTFVEAARHLQHQVDAVDLNLGCPQQIAKRGHYGAFLQDEWDLLDSIVRKASAELEVPVWCKIRIFPCARKSIAYARMLENAGCSVLAVHGRTRDQKGKFCPPADWGVIRAIKDAVGIPVIANGNVLSMADAKAALEDTGADAVMSAFALLDNPANFYTGPKPMPSRLELAREYLALAEHFNTPMRMVRLHLFKLLRSRLDVNMDLNDGVAACRSIDDFRAMCDKLEERCDADGFSFEARVAAGKTPRYVMAPKTVERMRRAVEAAAEAAASEGGAYSAESASSRGQDHGTSRRRLTASAGSGAYIDRSHFVVSSGSVSHSALADLASGLSDTCELSLKLATVEKDKC